MSYNSTILRKKRKLACGHFDYAFSKDRCKSCATVENTAKRAAKMEEAEGDESLQNLIEDADALFSRLIRLKWADSEGFVACYTSGKRLHYTQMQCGHFISRKHLGLRWNEDNARPQTEYDNCHLHGNLIVFRQKLEEEKPGLVDYLEEAARSVYKPTREELRELITNLRWKVKLAESKLKKK